MADPTNRNDPAYANNPKYVWSGGRWQYVSNPATANQAESGHVSGTVVYPEGPRQKTGAEQVAALSGGINNFANYQGLAQGFRNNAARTQGVNPYNAGIADQSRGAQMALIQQMRGQMAGPSIANMQGQRALGQSGQQALMGAAMGGPGGRAGMLQAGQIGGGLAGDVGQARLAEIMRAQAGMGGVAGNLRGSDLRSADAQMNSGMRAQDLADQNARFYGSMGSALDQARARQALENFKLGQRIDQRQTGRDINLANSLLGAGATGASAMFGGGKK